VPLERKLQGSVLNVGSTSIHNAHLIFTISSHSPGIVAFVGSYPPVEEVEMTMDANIRVRLNTGEHA
jgi:hypothetical protein